MLTIPMSSCISSPAATLSLSMSSSPCTPLYPFRCSFSIRMSSSPCTPSTTEHVVLCKVKQGTKDSQLSDFLTGLNGLRSLPMVNHLSTGAVHRNRSTTLNFTHMLHSRYASKEDLDAYLAHPAHLNVVNSCVLPISEDIMMVEWVNRAPGLGSAIRPGSALRVQFVKLKEGLGEGEKEEVLEVIGGLKDKVSGIEELSFGENFSSVRAKGFSIASIGVFKGLSELDAVDQNVEIAKEKERVRGYIDSLIIVDYVVPSPQSAANL